MQFIIADVNPCLLGEELHVEKILFPNINVYCYVAIESLSNACVCDVLLSGRPSLHLLSKSTVDLKGYV